MPSSVTPGRQRTHACEYAVHGKDIKDIVSANEILLIKRNPRQKPAEQTRHHPPGTGGSPPHTSADATTHAPQRVPSKPDTLLTDIYGIAALLLLLLSRGLHQTLLTNQSDNSAPEKTYRQLDNLGKNAIKPNRISSSRRATSCAWRCSSGFAASPPPARKYKNKKQSAFDTNDF